LIGRPSESDARAFLAGLEQEARGAEVQAHALRQGRESYVWGRRDRGRDFYEPFARSADAAIWESDDLMSRRLRDQMRNEPQCKRIRDAIEDLIVGPGMLTFADPFDPLIDLTALSKDTLDSYLSYALESDELFAEWFNDEKQFDIAGKRSGPDMQRMLVGENVERGGVLLLKVAAKGPNRTVPLAYQIVEYDQLDKSKDRPAGTSAGENKIIHGIEVDAQGREVAFHIFDAHPYDDFSGGSIAGKSSRISADRVIHLALFRRPSQSVGATWLAAIGQPTRDRFRFMGAEIQTAAKGALLLLIHKMQNMKARGTLGLLDGDDGSDEWGNPEMRLGSSTVGMQIPVSDEVDLVESNRPTDKAESFLSILDHDIAGASGLSYFTLSGRYEQASFSSVRAALIAEDCHFAPLMNWFAGKAALPIRRTFNAQAIALGQLKSVTAEQYLDNPRRYNRFDAIGPGRQLLDPAAETEMATGLLRSCLSTLKAESAKRGLHWIKILRQVALENHVLDVLGINLDLSKGQGGQVTGNTRSADSMQQAAAADSGKKAPAANSRKKGSGR
jgi:lambda family phage portal protein